MNIELNLDQPLLDFTGEQLEGNTLAKSLANILGSEGSKDESKIHKLPSWASSLFKNGSITIDEGDFKFIKETVVASDRFLPWVKSPILTAMDDARDKARKASEKKSDNK